MIRENRVLGVITARGGSRGLPGKHLRSVAGKPLIAWTIEEAAKSVYIDRLIISSDDEDIIAVARSFGCEVPFIRPADLARDDTRSEETLLHALDRFPDFPYVVLLQPTSPLRLAEDIDGCIRQCVEHGQEICVSVSETLESPYWMYRLDERRLLHPLLEPEAPGHYRRQNLPKIYKVNGAVYAAKVSVLRTCRTFMTPATAGYVIPPERAIDIDTETDLLAADYLLSRRSLEGKDRPGCRS